MPTDIHTATAAGRPARLRGPAGWLCLALAAGAAGLPAAGWAADEIRTTPGPASPRLYQVPPGPLVQVLQQIASQSGVLLYFDPGLARGLASPGLQGSHTVDDAFDAVLQAHGLRARRDASGGYRIEHAAAAPPVELAPIPIEGGAVRDAPYAAVVPGATKTATPVARLAQSASAVTAQELRARNPGAVPQALQYTAGVQVNNYGGNEVRNDWLVVRGVDAKLAGDYRDGLSQMPYDQIRARLPAYALESIEVLRGPVSSLYGQAAAGGIVNRVTKRPPQAPLAEAAMQAGSFGLRQGYLDLGGPLADDAAGGGPSYRLTATARRAGTQDRYDARHHYRDDLAYVAPAFAWRDADTSLTLLMHGQRDRNDGESRAYYPRRVLTGDYGYDRNEREVYSAGYLFEHRLGGDWTLRQSARYQQGRLTLRNLYPLALAADGRTLSRYQLAARERADGVAVDTRLEGKMAAAGLEHTVLAGIDFRRLDGTQQYRQAAAPSLDLDAPAYGLPVAAPGPADRILDLRQVERQWGLYLQDEARTGNWTFTLGGRHDWSRAATQDLLAGGRTRQADGVYSGRAGASYAFASGLAPYASYATAFLPQSGAAYDGRPFQPARAAQVEAGVKYQPPSGQGLYTLALFDLRQRRALTPDPDPAHAGFSTQTGRMRSRGVEFEAKARLARNWDVVAAYTYNDVDILAAGDGTQGRTPVVTPRHMAALWLDHAFSGEAGRGWSAGVGLRYLGTTYVDPANTMKNDAAAMVDAALRYDARAWRVAIDAANLFDAAALVCRNDRLNCRYGIARTVTATLTLRY